MGGINKELQHRCRRFNCNKIFDNRYEGSLANGYLVCDECYQKEWRIRRRGEQYDQ